MPLYYRNSLISGFVAVVLVSCDLSALVVAQNEEPYVPSQIESIANRFSENTPLPPSKYTILPPAQPQPAPIEVQPPPQFAVQAPNISLASMSVQKNVPPTPISTFAEDAFPQKTPPLSTSIAEETKPEPTFVNADSGTDTEPEEIVREETRDPLLDSALNFSRGTGDKKMSRPSSGALVPMISVIGSLLIVISIFLFLAILLKRATPKGMRPLPKDAFENLGRTQLTQKLQLHLLRLGNRLILVSVSLDGVTPITEVTDPDEVLQMLTLCRREDKNSSSNLFKKTLAQFASEKAEGGYFGTDVEERTMRKKVSAPQTPPSKVLPPKGGTAKNTSSIDLYSEPDESLVSILASGLK